MVNFSTFTFQHICPWELINPHIFTLAWNNIIFFKFLRWGHLWFLLFCNNIHGSVINQPQGQHKWAIYQKKTNYTTRLLQLKSKFDSTLFPLQLATKKQDWFQFKRDHNGINVSRIYAWLKEVKQHNVLSWNYWCHYISTQENKYKEKKKRKVEKTQIKEKLWASTIDLCVKFQPLKFYKK